MSNSVSLSESVYFFTLAKAIIKPSTCESIYLKDCAFCQFLLINDIVEAHCYVVDNSKLILMSIYEANLINKNLLQDISAT